MGSRGPVPFPTPVAKLADMRTKARTDEPKPEVKLPTCPKWLPGEAKAEWKRLGPRLERLGLISELDRATFAAYCLAWAKAKKAQESLQRTEDYTQATTGGESPSAWLKIQDAALAQLKSFGAEFGLSPSSRTRIGAEQPKSAKPSSRATDKHGRAI